jgi:CDP-glucose 4,6-dehydratase
VKHGRVARRAPQVVVTFNDLNNFAEGLVETFFGDAFRDKRVFVTGHTGFKGSWLTSWLLDLGAEVCGYSIGIPTQPSLFEEANLSAGIRHELGDIRDLVRLSSVIQSFRPDFVFHLAAQAVVSISYAQPLETLGVNIIGTGTILEALKHVTWPCSSVIITSDKAYDNVEWEWGYRESDRLGGKDIYSASKGAAELVFRSYISSFFASDNSPVLLATARAGNVIGGGDWAADRIVADCIRAWMNGKVVEIRSPQATRPWQHVLEPLSGYLTLASRLAGNRTLHGESFNFGPRAEQNATVLQLVSSLAEIWKAEDPNTCYRVTANVPFKEASLLKLNVDKALLRLRWEPNLSYMDCMEMTGIWYKEFVKNKASAAELVKSDTRKYESEAFKLGRVWAT